MASSFFDRLIALHLRAISAAIPKRSESNTCHALRNIYGGKPRTIAERQCSNAYDTVGYDHNGQATALKESIFSNAGHVVRNDYGGQATILIVFANCFISATCVLYGRKSDDVDSVNREKGEDLTFLTFL